MIDIELDGKERSLSIMQRNELDISCRGCKEKFFFADYLKDNIAKYRLVINLPNKGDAIMLINFKQLKE